MSRGRSRVNALEAQLKRDNPRLRIHCYQPGRERLCQVEIVGKDDPLSGGGDRLSSFLNIKELEQWVDGYTKCKSGYDKQKEQAFDDFEKSYKARQG